MDNPEKMASLDTQDTGRGQTKQKTQHRKLKRLATQNPPKTWVNSGACKGQAVTYFNIPLQT